MDLQPPGARPTEYVMRYRYSIDAALAAARLIRKRTIAINEAIGTLMTLIGILLAATGEPFGWAILVGGTVILILTWTDVVVRVLTRRAYGNLVGSEMAASFTERGIHSTSPLATVDVPWSAVTKVLEDRRTVLFLGGRVLLAYVPRAGFESADQRREAIAFARAMVAATRLGTSPST